MNENKKLDGLRDERARKYVIHPCPPETKEARKIIRHFKVGSNHMRELHKPLVETLKAILGGNDSFPEHKKCRACSGNLIIARRTLHETGYMVEHE